MQAVSRFVIPCLISLAALSHAFENPAKSTKVHSSLAFVHANVIPMDRELILNDQTILIVGHKIAKVGPSATIRIPRQTRQIDARGHYLIPGLTDAHVHLLSPIEFPLYLANGVTTVFNLDGRPAHLIWRKQVQSGKVLGPTILATGPIFHEKRTAAEDVRLVDEIAAAGYDGVKIYNQVSKEEYPALIAEAKRKHLLLMGHIARGPGFAMTLQAGQAIAHLEEIVYTNFNPMNDDDFSHLVLDESKIPAIAQQTKSSGIYVTPTLNMFSTIVQQATDLDSFLENPELHYLAAWTLAEFQPENDQYKNHLGSEKHAILRNMLALQRKLVKALSDDGVPLMAGTDATEVGPVAGFGLHHELQELVQDGLTPYQALRTATTTPSGYLKQSHDSGAIQVGKRADLVLLSTNPLADIASTQKILGVVVRGRWLDHKSLAAMLDAVPERYAREEKKLEALLQTHPDQVAPYLESRDPMGGLFTFSMVSLAVNKGQDVSAILRAARLKDSQGQIISKAKINRIGRSLLEKNLYPQAIAVLKLNTEWFPAANTWDSLADAFIRSGDVPDAVRSYQQALAADATYSNAETARKFITASSTPQN